MRLGVTPTPILCQDAMGCTPAHCQCSLSWCGMCWQKTWMLSVAWERNGRAQVRGFASVHNTQALKISKALELTETKLFTGVITALAVAVGVLAVALLFSTGVAIRRRRGRYSREVWEKDGHKSVFIKTNTLKRGRALIIIGCRLFSVYDWI